MAENEKTVAESVKEVMEATAPDAPKKNAVPAEPSPLKNDAEDLGAAVVKPTDSNPDATKKVKEVSGQAPQKSEGAPDPMPTLKKEGAKETDKDSEDKEIKEGEMPKAALDALKKHQKKVLKSLNSIIWKPLKSSVVIFQALETSSASLTSAASATSAASTASKWQFPQKKSDPDCLIIIDIKISNTGYFLWNGLPKIQFFTNIWHSF